MHTYEHIQSHRRTVLDIDKFTASFFLQGSILHMIFHIDIFKLTYAAE